MRLSLARPYLFRSHPNAQRQAGDACLGNDAHGNREAKRLRGGVKLTNSSTTAGVHDALVGNHTYVVDVGKIDDHSSIICAVSGDVMSTTAHGEQEAAFAGVVHGLHHTLRGRRARDENWVAINHAIPHLSRFFVSRVTG